MWGSTEPILGIFQTYNWLLCYIWIKTSRGQAREKGLKNWPLSYLDLVESVAHKLAINVRWNLTITQKNKENPSQVAKNFKSVQRCMDGTEKKLNCM